MSTGNGHFNLLARVLHWSMAVMIVAMLFIGVTMVASLHLRPMLIDLHRPLGITIGVLVLLRLYNRLRHRPPPLPADLPVWQVMAAKASHWMLYALMLAMPLIGWAMLSAASLTSVHTASSSHRPAPAYAVSRKCRSGESFLSRDTAMPPCARTELFTSMDSFVMISTRTPPAIESAV